jgi:ligand-binding SRPBCC domain-containing protein
MQLYRIERKQFIPLSIQETWSFFSDPENLRKITPDYMGFEIKSDLDTKVIYPGMIIIYVVKPVLKIPFQWVTEITHIDSPRYFVDEQRFGPYAFWHHKHFFRELHSGVEMLDLVDYGLPYGIVGKMIHKTVNRKLEEIFDFRIKKVEELFGSCKSF